MLRTSTCLLRRKEQAEKNHAYDMIRGCYHMWGRFKRKPWSLASLVQRRSLDTVKKTSHTGGSVLLPEACLAESSCEPLCVRFGHLS